MVGTLVKVLLVLAAMILPFRALYKAIREAPPASPVGPKDLQATRLRGPVDELADAILHEAWSRDSGELGDLGVETKAPSDRIRSLVEAHHEDRGWGLPSGQDPDADGGENMHKSRGSHLLKGGGPEGWSPGNGAIFSRARGPGGRDRGPRVLPDLDRVFASRRFIRFYEGVIDEIDAEEADP